ncbi:facilitated trehalose transporter Tret1-like isoform X2 [Contarinia nasturtii]|uniref:facilitated trehalose transporter Tret1-like isoform X2 n=1 Tax=Contarinia nasturtii TaxID=265458 RepID=UPI0012D431B0|nr:facilitated trehalose transporter Tret1-like isoform X2 [Contarinia nasturtii]XP_031623731.1 facilitated trehalose transporter Tret1-like isoform X2 [Contarinia nasturtii]XP_031623732.1 facilitated trehalose transporter Tret1-like isoform X2 [Contarinia nasturtii]XP_031623733.1 facilitated trehalose transporter Tret1-like isoform X2 [Contarinia nasturtii]
MMSQISPQTFQWKNIENQLFGTFAANLIMLSQGCIFGWASPALSKLTSGSTHLQSGALTREQSAEDAIKYYKGYRGLSDEEHYALYKECERFKSIAYEHKAGEKCQISDFFTNSAIKGLSIGVALHIFAQFSANSTITTYAVIIFQNAGTAVDPFVSSIILAIALFFGSLSTTYLADRLGRKVLNIISLTGSAIGLLGTAQYHYLYLHDYDLQAYQWMPVASLSFVVFISSAGTMPLAIVCSVENLPLKIRTVGMSIIAFSSSIAAFISVKFFPILLDMLSLYGCLIIYGIGSIVGAFFVHFFLEDTNGKSLDCVCIKESHARNNYNTFNTHSSRIPLVLNRK